MKNFNDFRIVYMGTPDISARVLEALIQEGFNIVAVIAQEDRPVGRKAIIMDVPTKLVAKKYNIPVYQPSKIRKDYEFIKNLKPDLILAMAYGQIVPQGLLDIPTKGALNLHGSILPKYRGAAPIQRAIINGEIETGVTLMEMIDKMDAGKIFGVTKCSISEEDNYSSLCEKISNCAIECAKNYLPKYLKDELTGIVQDENKVTFADKILPENEKLDLSLDAKTFINFVRGLSEEPGGYILLNDQKFKILNAKIYETKLIGKAGQLTINKSSFLNLKDKTIELLEVQMAGKKKMDGKSFANGNKQLNGIIAK